MATMPILRLGRNPSSGSIRTLAAPFGPCPDALIVEEGNPLKAQGGHGHGLADGWYVVQDEASQLVSLLVDPAADLRVLDTCASPGTGTTPAGQPNFPEPLARTDAGSGFDTAR